LRRQVPYCVVMLGALLCETTFAQLSRNVSLFGRIAPNPYRYSGSWYYVAPNGAEYALVGGYGGTHVIAIDDSTDIHQVGFVAGPQSNWREITVVGNHAFVVTEGFSATTGMQVISLAALPDSVHLATTYRATFTTGHIIMRDIHSDSAFVYVSGASGTGGVHILNVSNPAAPVQVGVYDPPYYIHDSHIRGNRLYASAGGQRKVDVVDISDKRNPTLIGNIRYQGAYTHSCWTTEDHKYLFVADEQDGQVARIFSIENLNTIYEVAQYSANLQSLVHNPYIRGRYAFIAHNTEGMRVVDIADPSVPVEVGFYDTYPGPSGGFNGLWSACPYLPSGKIIGGDRTGGLYVWKFNNTRAGRIYGTVTDSLTGSPIDSARILVVETGRTVKSKPTGAYKVGELPGRYSLRITAAGYFTKTINNGVLNDGDSLTLNIALKALATSAEPEILDTIVVSPGIEPSLALNQTNPQQLFLTAHFTSNVPPFNRMKWAFSTNGGTHWAVQEGVVGISDALSHSLTAFSLTGRAYFVVLGSPGAIFVVSTTNLGATWSAPSNADPLNSTADDTPSFATDLSGVYPNNAYAAWTDFGVSANPIQFTRSTDNGSTWSARTTLAIGSSRGQGAHIATGPAGEVYVVWAHYGVGSVESAIGFAKSTDGGATFGPPRIAFAISGIRVSNGGVPDFNSTRVNSFPSIALDRSTGVRRGWIYVVYADRNTGDADIYMRRSTNGGTTWSDSIRVNGEPVGNGKQQWFPSIAVDPVYGDINISYLNMDTTGFLTARYFARSTDGGNSWQQFRVSKSRFTPTQASGTLGYADQTAAYGRKAWTVWCDSLTTHIARVLYSSTSVRYESQSTPGGFLLHQNFPNPFNPATKIQYQVPSFGFVTLKVYDLLGREITTLTSEQLPAGEYERSFDASNLPSGIYFYQLRAGSFIETKKMVMVR